MTQFKAFNPEVEVNKQTVLSIVNSMEEGKELRLQILKDNGIDPETSEWFSQQAWLAAFKDIAEKLGEMNLFIIGKAIIDNAEFPPIEGLKNGLGLIDVAYHMNHKIDETIMFNPESGSMTEGIGHYTLAEFDEVERKAIMICNNPYPSKFDEGIIMQVARRFNEHGGLIEVKLDPDKETRKEGAESCTYIVSW